MFSVLTMTTQCVGIWMSLPRVSYIKAIDIWMSTTVMFVFAAMLEFAVVNTLARKEIRKLSIKARALNDDNSGDMVRQYPSLKIITIHSKLKSTEYGNPVTPTTHRNPFFYILS